jgi:hypothetical protein
LASDGYDGDRLCCGIMPFFMMELFLELPTAAEFDTVTANLVFMCKNFVPRGVCNIF